MISMSVSAVFSNDIIKISQQLVRFLIGQMERLNPEKLNGCIENHSNLSPRADMC
jgi:hypothetical protein